MSQGSKKQRSSPPSPSSSLSHLSKLPSNFKHTPSAPRINILDMPPIPNNNGKKIIGLPHLRLSKPLPPDRLWPNRSYSIPDRYLKDLVDPENLEDLLESPSPKDSSGKGIRRRRHTSKKRKRNQSKRHRRNRRGRSRRRGRRS